MFRFFCFSVAPWSSTRASGLASTFVQPFSVSVCAISSVIRFSLIWLFQLVPILTEKVLIAPKLALLSKSVFTSCAKTVAPTNDSAAARANLRMFNSLDIPPAKVGG